MLNTFVLSLVFAAGIYMFSGCHLRIMSCDPSTTDNPPVKLIENKNFHETEKKDPKQKPQPKKEF